MNMILIPFVLLGAPCMHILGQSADFWNSAARKRLHDTLQLKKESEVAKNIVFFLGDGMGMSSLSVGRIYKGLEINKGRPDLAEAAELEWEKFPHVGLAKTYSADMRVTDSAASACAFFCGVKTNFKFIGLDATAKLDSCSSMTEDNKLSSILKWMQDAGKATGFITTSPVTDATPANLYAHSPQRDWRHDGAMPLQERARCKDIADQLITTDPGRNINVILGGGRAHFFPNSTIDVEHPDTFGLRHDNRDLVEEWKRDKRRRNLNFEYVTNKKQFNGVSTGDIKFLLGLFEPTLMQHDLEQPKGFQKEPSLAEMTTMAVKILSKAKHGFFLMIEDGQIDHFHHQGQAVKAIHDVLNLDDAVGAAYKLSDPKMTLTIVTSDHSQGLVFNGYQRRGDSIFGKVNDVDRLMDKMPYTPLLYGLGPGHNHNGTRQNLTNTNTADPDYRQQSAVPRKTGGHTGEDVPVYATGPRSHIFHGVFEQNYIAHAMAYAACVGNYAFDTCHKKGNSVNVVRDEEETGNLEDERPQDEKTSDETADSEENSFLMVVTNVFALIVILTLCRCLPFF